MEVNSSKSFSDLPLEIKLYCLSFLNMREVTGLRTVCSEWKLLADDQSLWRLFLSDYFLNPPPLSSSDEIRTTIRDLAITLRNINLNRGEERIIGRVYLNPRPIQLGNWVVFRGEHNQFVRLWQPTQTPVNIEAGSLRQIVDWTILNRDSGPPALVLLERSAIPGKHLLAWICIWIMESQPVLQATFRCHGKAFFAVSRVHPLHARREQLAIAAPDELRLFDPFEEPIQSVRFGLQTEGSEENCTFMKGIGSGLVMQLQSRNSSRLVLLQCMPGDLQKRVEIVDRSQFDRITPYVDKLVKIQGQAWANERGEIVARAREVTLNAEGGLTHHVWGDGSGWFIDHLYQEFRPDLSWSVVVHSPHSEHCLKLPGAFGATWVTGLTGLRGVEDFVVIPVVRVQLHPGEGDPLKIALKKETMPCKEEFPTIRLYHAIGTDAAPVPGVLGAIAVRVLGFDTRIFLFGPTNK